MRKIYAVTLTMLMSSTVGAFAQVRLNTYADKDGYLNVQQLTCAQLAGTFQEDADMLAAWYSGWYNGLAKGNRANIDRIKEAEHRGIVYCKANQSTKGIKANDIIFTQMRSERGIVLE